MADDKELKTEEVKSLPVENKKEVDPSKKLNEQIEALKAELLAKDQLIAELNIALAAKEDENEKLSKFPVIAHKSKKYELVDAKSTARFNGKNVLVTVQTLKEIPGLLAYCIEKEFSCLKEKGAK